MARRLTAKAETDVVVRRARASDKKPLIRFIKGIWGGHDYIPYVWDRWLKDPSGQMFVAEVGGEPVGMNRVRCMEDGSAWLEGARVHPAHRGRGVATALGESSMAYLRERGVKVFRLASRSRNFPAHRQIARMSFREVTRLSVFERKSARKLAPREEMREAEESETESLYRGLLKSRDYARYSGLVCASWTCISLTREVFSRWVKAGGVVVSDGAAALVRRGREGKEEWNEVCFLSGRTPAAMDIVRRMASAGPSRRDIYVIVPVGSRYAGPLRRLGFRRSTSLVIFEKSVKG